MGCLEKGFPQAFGLSLWLEPGFIQVQQFLIGVHEARIQAQGQDGGFTRHGMLQYLAGLVYIVPIESNGSFSMPPPCNPRLAASGSKNAALPIMAATLLAEGACELQGITHVVLVGEGTFHQFHGGVTTGGLERRARAALLEDFQDQYQSLRGAKFQPPESEPVFLGEIPPQLMRFLRVSSQESSSAGVQQDAVPERPTVRLIGDT